MYLYNETVGIEQTVEQEWLEWIKLTYIPKALESKLFTEYRIYKVLHDTNDDTVSYSIQFFSTSLDHVVKYLEVFAPALVEEQRKKFNNRHVAFRTLLEEVK